MKTLKYLLIIVLSMGALNSCLVDQTISYDEFDEGPSLIIFEAPATSFSVFANGDEYERQIRVKLVGPTSMEVTGDINVTVSVDPSSSANAGEHFTILNPTFTLTKANNYLGLLNIKILTEGNAPPLDGTPEFDAYKAPVIVLSLTAAGNSKVLESGKLGKYTLAYTPPSPFAGVYESEVWYFHPTDGGSYPDEPYGGIRYADKTLKGITGRKCETWFGVWESEKCWITVNANNSVDYTVWDEWGFEVKMGDPKDPSKVSHYDPGTGIIYLYYYYSDTGGDRIFWETLIPGF